MIIRNLIDGKTFEYEINTLHIYNETGVLFETNRGLEAKKLEGEKLKDDYETGSIFAFELGEIRNARTINFNKKDCFLKKRPVDYRFECNTDLYIHSDFIKAQYLGEKIAMETADETNYLRTYNLFFKTVLLKKENYEKIPLKEGENFFLPEGAQWSSCYGTIEKPCYDTYTNKLTNESGVIKRWITETIKKDFSIVVTAPFYSKTEYSENRLKAKEIAEKINELKCFYKDVSFFEIERLLKHFELLELED